MQVTIGGDRVGSGKKMKTSIHNYNRSTHNLSETFASSMTCGVLYPALCKLAMRGDSFDISINADCRTIPTVGPLFGSFKMQVDVYQVPVRLYQAILHNNPLAIGLKAGQVKFPVLKVLSNDEGGEHKNMKCNTSSLMHYLGMSGLGHSANTPSGSLVGRKINAIPFIGYYDIFKTYYANKQEDKAYVIGGETVTDNAGTRGDKWYTYEDGATGDVPYNTTKQIDVETNRVIINIPSTHFLELVNDYKKNKQSLIAGQTLITVNIGADAKVFEYSLNQIINAYILSKNGEQVNYYYSVIKYVDFENNANGGIIEIELDTDRIKTYAASYTESEYDVNVDELTFIYGKHNEIKLREFNLSNIDDMRYDLLSYHTLGSAYEIEYGEQNCYMPYEQLVARDNNHVMYNTYPMNGLVLKTYQNDIFNNWLNTEWIEGENSITELTKVAIVDGAFSMDSLNFAQKQYNMLNRIAVAGATYEDWQDVVYEEVKRRQIESPIFVGGMSQEVVFDEIIQNAPANVDGITSQLGDLGGRGKLADNKKGGKIHVKCDEACFIIAIVSLTPRLYYTQGNEFYLTDVLSLDDMHKPPMDGIGFQDLIGERMAWWDTVITPQDYETSVLHRSKIGKLPAWIEYMTSFDRAHGDFAEEAAGYMVLSRRYEQNETGGIKDATTYVDPTKYNYAFAYRDLDSQNFWVQIGFNIKARRLMSARLIPNV